MIQISDNNEYFDIDLFLNELIEKMGLDKEDPAKLSTLKKSMYQGLRQAIFQAAAENLEPEVIQVVLQEQKNETDPGYIIQELLQTSPSAQLAMIEAINAFEKNTLEAYNALKV